MESALIYDVVVHRYYDPATGTFLSVDPLVAFTQTPYSYAGDNPLNAIDPLGLTWWNPTTWSGKTWDTIAVVAGGVALAATGVGVLADVGIIGAEAGAGLVTAASYTAVGGGLVTAGIDGFGCVDNQGRPGVNGGDCFLAAVDLLSLGSAGAAAQAASDAARAGLDVVAFEAALSGLTWNALQLGIPTCQGKP